MKILKMQFEASGFEDDEAASTALEDNSEGLQQWLDETVGDLGDAHIILSIKKG